MDAHAGEALEELVSRVPHVETRTVLGLVGAPGAGKTYSAQCIERTLERWGIPSAVLPMDGFHLSNAQLEDLGIRDRKGAPDTFDVDGLIHALGRIRQENDRPVFLPDYDRDVHEPIAARRRIDPRTRVVIIEGNYLLHEEDNWNRVGEYLDCAWFLHVSESTREERLVERKLQAGWSRAAAEQWVREVDGANAGVVFQAKPRADRVINALSLESQLQSATAPV